MNDLANKYNIKMPSIGENIKKFRKEKGLTQKQLAEKCGMAEITIRQYETGKREPRLEQQEIICEKLGISMISLISGTSDAGANAQFLAGMQDGFDMVKSGGVEKISEWIELEIKWRFNYKKLNIEGKKKAVDHVEMLAKIPEYQRMVTDVFAGNQSVEDLLEEEDSPDQDQEEE